MRPVVVPGGVPETFTDSKGREHLVYRAPLPSEGPVEAVTRSGRRVWLYMFAHFVFSWEENTHRLTIAHGTIQGPRMLLWQGIPIDEHWSAGGLSRFGRAWVGEHLAKFRA
ncbi:hypothetical protein [Amycolatopsis anabasis]|uniref:hypothetical protein n=1 Tax=Amycolatopsis anabasis TaxID=1840409 RepID=UPI001FE2DF45|nr:hypothetical protein [Amycolatopsis anabasis]